MKNSLIINLGKSFGGVEVHISDILKNINRRKFKIYIMCRENSLFHKHLIDLQELYEIILIPCEFSLRNIFTIISTIKKLVKKNNIKVVHTHGILSSFLYSLIKIENVKFITTTHGYNHFDRMDRKKIVIKIFDIMEFYSLRKSHICVAVSNDIKRYISEKKINEKKIVVINNGIYIKNYIYKEINKTEDNIIIKSLGRLEEVKGFDILINAMKLVINSTNKKIICKIAGTGNEKDKLENIIKENNLKSVCELVGFVDNPDEFLEDADIYVQPSLMESFGISILEAMNNQIPVIASNVGGITDIIEDQYNGVFFKIRNFEELADKIIYLINNRDKRTDIIINANRILNEKFNIKDKIKDLEKLY